MDEKKLAVVTGANRGIGLEIARQLGRKGLRVVVGSRDAGDGRTAAVALVAEGIAADARELDVTREETVRALAAWVRDAHGGLDVLVNNAGVVLDGFDAEVARKTIDVNYFGMLRMTDALLPLVRAGGRIVLLTSAMGSTQSLPGPLRARFHAPDLGREELDRIMEGFVRSVAAGTHARDGWPSSAYRVSKMGVDALAGVLARQLADDGRGILCNAASPGWVKTRMGGAAAPRSVEEGADTPVWLALLPAGGPHGGVFEERRPLSW
jgi:carbonyl reductase 1